MFVWWCFVVMMVLVVLLVLVYVVEDDCLVIVIFGGCLYLDFVIFDNDNRGILNKDDIEICCVWFDVLGKFFVVDYKLEVDFFGDCVEVKDVYLVCSFGKVGKLIVGQFKQYFLLDDCISFNYGSFLECGNVGIMLVLLYCLGVFWQVNLGDFIWVVSIYSLESIDVWQVKGCVVGGCVIWVFLFSDGDVLYLGLLLVCEVYDNLGVNGVFGLCICLCLVGYLFDNSCLILVDFFVGCDIDVNKWLLEYVQVCGLLLWQGEFSGVIFDDGV